MSRKPETFTYRNCDVEYSINEDKGQFSSNAGINFGCGDHNSMEPIYLENIFKTAQEAEDAIIEAAKKYIDNAIDIEKRYVPVGE